MKLNKTTALTTSKLLLVPYNNHHVPQYHTWMQDPELQSATASESLTLEEEYAMQQSWRTDRDKLTFIICLPLSTNPPGSGAAVAGKDDADDRMIGDINLFLFDADDDDANLVADGPSREVAVVGEIELMIARKDLHRKGYGRAALLAFMYYVLSSWPRIATEYSPSSAKALNLAYVRVKINQSNQRSIALFESVGFKMSDGPNYFGEVELRWKGDVATLAGLPWFEQPRTLQYALSG